MEPEFHSQLELFQRVRPALEAKETELKRLGFTEVSAIDVWNYLVEVKWKKGNGLMLSDIVDDILNTDCQSISEYAKNPIPKEIKSFEDSNIL